MSATCYVVLLRGINVSGQKLIKMAELRTVLESVVEFSNVQTYIQSGNIVLYSEIDTASAIEKLVGDLILSKFGFEVPIMARKSSQIENALKKNPFDSELKKDPKKVYFTFLSEKPEKEAALELENLNFPDEYVKVVDQVLYFYSPNPLGRAKFNNKLIERKLKMRATTRNYRTLTKLLDMAGNS